jgi:hypothetical protein
MTEGVLPFNEALLRHKKGLPSATKRRRRVGESSRSRAKSVRRRANTLPTRAMTIWRVAMTVRTPAKSLRTPAMTLLCSSRRRRFDDCLLGEFMAHSRRNHESRQVAEQRADSVFPARDVSSRSGGDHDERVGVGTRWPVAPTLVLSKGRVLARSPRRTTDAFRGTRCARGAGDALPSASSRLGARHSMEPRPSRCVREQCGHACRRSAGRGRRRGDR